MTKEAKPHIGSRRKCAALGNGVEKRLISYAAMATAAGVGALAGPPAAEAKVVYTDTWISIVPKGGPYPLDLNNDGVADFMLSVRSTTNSYGTYRRGTMNLIPQNTSNGAIGSASASALPAGVPVGSQAKFGQKQQLIGRENYDISNESGTNYRYRSFGKWTQTTRQYLGVRFVIQGQIHYGWARMNVTSTPRGVFGAISGFAYESDAGVSILTGQTGGEAPAKRKARLRGSIDPRNPRPGGLGALAAGTKGDRQ